MKNITSPASRLLAGLFMFVLLFTAACGAKEGTVESVNQLYGTDSKTWKTDKEMNAAGDKVAQTDAMDDQRVTFYANGQYNMMSGAQTMNGKYTFDQGAKTITMMPDGAGQSNTFTVVTLTDDKLTLKGTDGSELRLERE
ncbi:lipocalin family protein [Hymenobacter lapidiphilus]|uniref:Lipocalin-like domain-containing protein n=1 Tax=Hymenobacter lapidiphilus TaxID=2608003 RepID=A0A7Y7PLT6_9BACT|nr:lipocalin family protein [Hymenobacter lapidiphilus]NVO30183.1 hypothetical protein [Hymenobacter lapidiphilus]